MADGLRVGELLPEVQKKFTQEELDQILRVGSVAFLAGTSHLFLTISEASTMAGQLVLLESVRLDISVIAKLSIP